jgi:lipocalin
MPVGMLFGETQIKINFDLSSYLTAWGEVIGDRTDVIFMLKSAKTLADVDAEYSVVEGSDLVVNGNTLEITIGDFSGLVAGTRYFFGVGVKFAGDITYRELRFTPATDSIIFTADVIRG